MDGLSMPIGSLFYNGEMIASLDIINYDDFITELKWFIMEMRYSVGLYTYYEGHNLIYKYNVTNEDIKKWLEV